MPGSAPNCTHTCHTAVHAHRTTPWTRSCAHTGHPGVLTRTDTPTRTGTRARTHVYTATQAVADTEQQAHMPRGARGRRPFSVSRRLPRSLPHFTQPLCIPNPFPVPPTPLSIPVLAGSPLPERGRLTWMRGRAGNGAAAAGRRRGSGRPGWGGLGASGGIGPWRGA